MDSRKSLIIFSRTYFLEFKLYGYTTIFSFSFFEKQVCLCDFMFAQLMKKSFDKRTTFCNFSAIFKRKSVFVIFYLLPLINRSF